VWLAGGRPPLRRISLGCKKEMPLRSQGILPAVATLLLGSAGCGAHTERLPFPDRALTVHWVATHAWTDTVATHSDSVGCSHLLQDYAPSAHRRPSDTLTAKERHDCQQVFLGRHPRDSTQVAVAPNDLLARTYVVGARVPYRLAAGIPTCPWPERPALPGTGLALRVECRVLSDSSLSVEVYRRCNRQRGDPMPGGFFSSTLYLLMRSPVGWRVVKWYESIT
jgi:hypothetical protein